MASHVRFQDALATLRSKHGVGGKKGEKKRAAPVDLLAQRLSAPVRKKAASATVGRLERPVASFGGLAEEAEEEEDLGARRPGRVAVPTESRVFGRPMSRAPRGNNSNVGGRDAAAWPAPPPAINSRPKAYVLVKKKKTTTQSPAAASRGLVGRPSSQAGGALLAHEAPLDAAEVDALKSSRSRHAAAAAKQTVAASFKQLAGLEKREAAADAAATIAVRAVKVRCFSCRECGTLGEVRSPDCDRRRHAVAVVYATRRQFECGACLATKASLGHAPKKPCLRCGQDRWRELRETRRVAKGPEAAFRPALAEWTARHEILHETLGAAPLK